MDPDGILPRLAAVGGGAVLGANLRYLVVNAAAERWGTEFPYGTFLINVSGAFAIGVLLALFSTRFPSLHPLWTLFFATGFLGGFTTFSSYAWEALQLAEGGAIVRAAVYVLGTNVVGLLGVWLGVLLTRLLR